MKTQHNPGEHAFDSNDKVLGDALQFYSFNKYSFCGHSAVMGERVEPGRTRAGFWNFFLIQ